MNRFTRFITGFIFVFAATATLISPAFAGETDDAVNLLSAKEYIGPEFISEVTNQLELNYVDADALNYPRMYNAALKGVAHALANHGGEFVPTPIDEDVERVAAFADFSAQFEEAKVIADELGTVNEGEMAFAAANALCQSLNSSHTYFYTPEAADESEKRKNGEPSFSGIGVILKMFDENFVYINWVMRGGPADKARLKRFDRLISIDGVPVAGNLKAAIPKIRGKKGTVVKLVIERAGKPMIVNVVRDDVTVPVADFDTWKEKGKTYALIHLYVFDKAAPKLISDFLKKNRPDGIIFDVRDNPGGLVYVLGQILEMFENPNTPVCIVKDRNGVTNYVTDDAARPLTSAPIVILTDDGSGSASEIFTASMTESGRAVAVGETTAGACELAQVKALSHGAAMVVAIGRVYTPSEKPIEGVGVVPDVEVPLAKEDVAAGHDSQLEAAKKQLQKKMTEKKVKKMRKVR